MRAIEQRIDAAAEQAQRAVHLVVDGIEGRHVEQAAADSGLVRSHHYPVAGVVEPGNGFQTARDRLPLVRVLDELVAVLVDDAVAIEDDKLHGQVNGERGTGNGKTDAVFVMIVTFAIR